MKDDLEDFVLKEFVVGEKCLVLYSSSNQRKDDQPNLFIHSLECWERKGHVCPNLPAGYEHGEADHPNGVFEDLDFYTPTLHIGLESLVYGDIRQPGSSINWVTIKEIIKKKTI